MRKRQRHTSPAQIREKSAAAHARIDAPLPSAQPDAAIPFSIQLVFMYRQRPAPVRRIAFRRMTQRRPRTNLATTNRHCMRRAAAASRSSRRVVLTPAPDRMHRRQRRPLSASSRRCASIDRCVRYACDRCVHGHVALPAWCPDAAPLGCTPRARAAPCGQVGVPEPLERFWDYVFILYVTGGGCGFGKACRNENYDRVSSLASAPWPVSSNSAFNNRQFISRTKFNGALK